MNILEVTNLTKKFGKLSAVDDISFNIKEKEIYGLLGPNGAGKSTTINMICGLLSPNEGHIKVLDKDIKKYPKFIKKNLGIVPQDIAIYEDLTAYENVTFFGSLYSIGGSKLKAKALEALEFVGLRDKAKEFPSKFSGGMKRRLNIACALVHDPKLIIMDEPTVGIDPQSRNHILESIKKLNEKGCTIVYTSHYMEEVEAICNKIGIIDQGKIIAEGTKDQLKKICTDTNMVKVSVDTTKNLDVNKLKEIDGVVNVAIKGKVININTLTSMKNLDKIIIYFIENDITINNIENVSVDLETIFLKLTGKNLRD
ncbi:ABC transporter ATP-binding protein [Clostridium oceanicum]|uniref:ABC transporter ATP-binding protein n=1 Tax=Clostridium oceanicum TaxID=1543 RepID=A0ABP3UHT2_9CLOT